MSETGATIASAVSYAAFLGQVLPRTVAAGPITLFLSRGPLRGSPAQTVSAAALDWAAGAIDVQLSTTHEVDADRADGREFERGIETARLRAGDFHFEKALADRADPIVEALRGGTAAVTRRRSMPAAMRVRALRCGSRDAWQIFHGSADAGALHRADARGGPSDARSISSGFQSSWSSSAGVPFRRASSISTIRLPARWVSALNVVSAGDSRRPIG